MNRDFERPRRRCAGVANELILIVEDNPKNLKLVRDPLGEEGLRLAHERHPALILMEVQLPGISGIEAPRQLRADPVTPPSCCSASSRWPTAAPPPAACGMGKENLVP